MISVRNQQIDRFMLVLAIMIFAVTFGFAALALHDEIVSRRDEAKLLDAPKAESGADTSR